MFHLPLPVGTKITQRFGERSACVSTDSHKRVISCDGNNPPRGYRSIYGPEGHKGLDFRARRGLEVYNSMAGEVIFVDNNPRTGLDCRILSKFNGKNYIHIYEHLMSYKPKRGDIIPTGSLIGKADSTGYSSADHLHFEIKEVSDYEISLIRSNVEVYIRTVGKSVDPETLLSDKYAKNMMFKKSPVSYSAEQLSLALDRLSNSLRSLIIYLNRKS